MHVRDSSRAAVLHALDLGARGIIIPDVQSVEEARRLVEYAKYYPLGARGFAFSRSAKYGFLPELKQIGDYFTATNQRTILMPQCETAGALEHIEEIAALDGRYNPRALYESDMRIRRAVDTLIDGTLDDGRTGMFRELYSALLDGASWHAPDCYFLLHDFIPYCDTRLRANRDYADRAAFAKKCLLNVAHAGPFSSDRTVAEYALGIWGCL